MKARKRLPFLKWTVREIDGIRHKPGHGMVGIQQLFLMTGEGLKVNQIDCPLYFHQLVIDCKKIANGMVEVLISGK